MKIDRVRSGGTRPRRQAAIGRGGLAAVLLAPIVVGAALLLPRTSLPGPASAATGVPLESFITETGGPVESSDRPAQRGPLSLDEIKGILSAEAAKRRFDGSALSWRIAPYAELQAEGIGDPASVDRSCEPYEAGAEKLTQLDFTVTYLPPEFKIGPVEGPIKWLCGNEGISVLFIYNVDTALGAGQIFVERSIRARQILELDVPHDSVEAGAIRGTPAIIAHPADDATGLGVGHVIVIEDDGHPEFTILRVTADNGVPFDELIKIAEGIK